MILDAPEARALIASGLAEYRAGRYWHAHEHWERVWSRLADAERHWVQGLILITAAAWHLERRHERVARRLLALAAERLDGCTGLPGVEAAAKLARLAREAAVAPLVEIPPLRLD